MKEAIEGLARAIDRKNEEINRLLNKKTEYLELVHSLEDKYSGCLLYLCNFTKAINENGDETDISEVYARIKMDMEKTTKKLIYFTTPMG